MPKITIKAKCDYCGRDYFYTARSKAEAKRMEGGKGVCNSRSCQDRYDADVQRMLKNGVYNPS